MVTDIENAGYAAEQAQPEQRIAEISREIEQLLDCLDCSSIEYIGADPNLFDQSYSGQLEPPFYFEFKQGMNEGSHITIGFYCYRCHVDDMEKSGQIFNLAVSTYMAALAAM